MRKGMHCHKHLQYKQQQRMCVHVCVHNVHTHTHNVGECKLQNQNKQRSGRGSSKRQWALSLHGWLSSPPAATPSHPAQPPGPNHPRLGFHQRARPLFPMSPGLGRRSKGGFRLALSAVSTWRARFPEQVLGHLGPAPPPTPPPCPLVVHLALGLGQGPRSQEPLKPPGPRLLVDDISGGGAKAPCFSSAPFSR